MALTTQCADRLVVHRKRAVVMGANEAEITEATFVAMVLPPGVVLTHGTHLIKD